MNGPLEQIPGSLKAPLFPLPNVVLFPRAILPLHIFEDRYKQMMADVLSGDSQIAMALLRAGWEKNYHCRPAIEPVVCVGRVVAHERMKDGTYNLLLQGQIRAAVQRESGGRHGDDTEYRLAELSPLAETSALEIDLSAEREELRSLISNISGQSGQTAALFSSTMRTADIADLVAFRYLDNVGLKQSLLADGDIRRRVERLVKALRGMEAVLHRAQRGGESSGLN